MRVCAQPFPSTDNHYHFHQPEHAHPCGIEAPCGDGGMELAVPYRLSHGGNTVYPFGPPGPVLSYSAPVRTAEARTSVQDIIDTPSVSKACRTKGGAVSLDVCNSLEGLVPHTKWYCLAPSGARTHKTSALLHGLQSREQTYIIRNLFLPLLLHM